MYNRKYLRLLLCFFLEKKSKLWMILAKTWRYMLSILNTWLIIKTYKDLSHNQNIPLERLDVKTIRFFDKSMIASMNVCCMILHQNNIN